MDDAAFLKAAVSPGQVVRERDEARAALTELYASVEPYGIADDGLGACSRYCLALRATEAVLAAYDAAREEPDIEDTPPETCHAVQHDPEGIGEPHPCGLPFGHVGLHEWIPIQETP